MNTHEQTKWLSEFYGEAHRTGRKIEKMHCGRWEDDTLGRGPGLHSDPKFWRLRPEPEKVWVVWYPSSTVPQVFLDAASAEHYASRTNGIIQEITRPEPQ
jgi:hypothetical protein